MAASSEERNDGGWVMDSMVQCRDDPFFLINRTIAVGLLLSTVELL